MGTITTNSGRHQQRVNHKKTTLFLNWFKREYPFMPFKERKECTNEENEKIYLMETIYDILI
jgi:hypothetical protein